MSSYQLSQVGQGGLDRGSSSCSFMLCCWDRLRNPKDTWETMKISLSSPAPLSRLRPKLVPLLLRAAFGGRRHWLPRHHRAMFHFRFVLSWSYTPGFHSINDVPYLTLWFPSLFCALLFVIWVLIVRAWDYCICSLLESYLFWSTFWMITQNCVLRLTLHFSMLPTSSHKLSATSQYSDTCGLSILKSKNNGKQQMLEKPNRQG